MKINGLCQCGCGEKAPIAKQTDRRKGYKKGKPERFINGHQNRGINHPLYGKKLSEKRKKLLSRLNKGKNHPFYGKKHTEETKEKMSRAGIGKFFTEEHREKISQARLGTKHSKEWKINMSVKMKGRIFSSSHRSKLSEAKKRNWADKEYREKIMKATLSGLCQRPTGLEQDMMSLIKKHNLPYKYVGNGDFWIGGKNPDFVNINGEKKLIEVGCEYFKNKKYGSVKNYIEKRRNHFAQYGWESYIFITDKLNEDEIIKTL